MDETEIERSEIPSNKSICGPLNSTNIYQPGVCLDKHDLEQLQLSCIENNCTTIQYWSQLDNEYEVFSIQGLNGTGLKPYLPQDCESYVFTEISKRPDPLGCSFEDHFSTHCDKEVTLDNTRINLDETHLGKRPACIGQEISPMKGEFTRKLSVKHIKNIHCERKTFNDDQKSMDRQSFKRRIPQKTPYHSNLYHEDSTYSHSCAEAKVKGNSVSNTTQDSDATIFMDKPLYQGGVSKSVHLRSKKRLLTEKLKAVGLSLKGNKNTLKTLAVL